MPEDRGEHDQYDLTQERTVRVISIMDRRPSGKEIHGITHPSLFLVRSKLLDDNLSGKEGWIEANDPEWAPSPRSGRRTYPQRLKNHSVTSSWNQS